MGERKSRIAKFLELHPNCYFCGATATTEDHVPPRTMFKRREGPEGFGFPACESCNGSTRHLEQVVALHFILADLDSRNHDPMLLLRLVSGVRNNAPEMLPNLDISANEKRRILSEYGLRPPPGETFADQPVVLTNPGVRQLMQRFARKLICALFYKHEGRVLPPSHRLLAEAFPAVGAQPAIKNFISLFPALELTGRTNVKIGDQFAYKWGRSADGELFGFLAQFGAGYFVFGAATGHHDATTTPNWSPHSHDLEAISPGLKSQL